MKINNIIFLTVYIRNGPFVAGILFIPLFFNRLIYNKLLTLDSFFILYIFNSKNNILCLVLICTYLSICYIYLYLFSFYKFKLCKQTIQSHLPTRIEFMYYLNSNKTNLIMRCVNFLLNIFTVLKEVIFTKLKKWTTLTIYLVKWEQ